MNIAMNYEIMECLRYNVFCQHNQKRTDAANGVQCFYSDTTYSRREAKAIMEVHYAAIHGKDYTNEENTNEENGSIY